MREAVKQIGLRIPLTMLDHMNAAAKNAGRSVNSELVRRLENSVTEDEKIKELQKRVQVLEDSARTDRETITNLAIALAGKDTK